MLQDALYPYHLVELAGFIVNAVQDFLNMHHAGAVLVGWLGLVWTRDLQLSAVAVWLGYSDLLLTMLSRWRGM